jgi:Flp pilus assembly protein TadB
MARRIHNPIRGSLHAARERIAETRAARKQRRADKREKEGSDWLDCVDCPGGGDIDDLAIILLAIVAVVLLFFLLVWIAPVVWAILLVLVEFFVVTIAAIAILVWRTLLRRPWRVVARRIEAGESWAHEVVGYRAARRKVREVAESLRLGITPGDLGFVAREPAP